jgi:hypothetical protein
MSFTGYTEDALVEQPGIAHQTELGVTGPEECIA